MDPGTCVIHASCVAFGRRGAVILGPSGAGKSTLALQLMGLGAALVADDQVLLTRTAEGGLRAAAPPGLPALIEARGVGLLNASLQDCAEIMLVVDLSGPEPLRLPPRGHTSLNHVQVEVVRSALTGHLPFVIRQYLLAGRGE